MSFHRLMRISSKERDPDLSDSSSNFTVNFNNCSDMQNIRRVAIKQVSIPNVGYNIVTGVNDTFTWEIVGVPTTITIAEGQYNLTTLINAIVGDAASIAIGLAITQNAITNKLEFTNTTNIEYLIQSDGNSMADTLGIKTGSVGDVASYFADGLPDLSGDQELYIASNTLSDGSNLCDPLLQVNGICAVVPLNVEWGGIEHYIAEDVELNDIEYPSQGEGKTINSVDIKVFNDRGRNIDLQGLEWVLILKIYY